MVNSSNRLSISAIVVLLAKISFFADKPQDLPSSNRLVILFAFALLGVTMLVGMGQGESDLLKISATQVVVYGAVVWLVLRFRNKAGRWPQTMLALFGTSCVIRLISYFPMNLIHQFSQSTEDLLFWSTFIILPFGIWILCVSAFIFREALETTSARAFFVAFGVALFVSLIVYSIVPISLLSETHLQTIEQSSLSS